MGWPTEARIQFLVFISFFSILQEAVLLSQSNLSALKLVKRSQAPQKGAKGGCFSEANDKMYEARWSNSCNMNNDAIMMLGGHCHGNKILSVWRVLPCTSQSFTTESYFNCKSLFDCTEISERKDATYPAPLHTQPITCAVKAEVRKSIMLL